LFDETIKALHSIFDICPDVRWEDTDPPADNILEARLRAKLYGGIVITYRHCLRAVLNLPFKSSTTTIPTKVLAMARKCVVAMICSTEAFLHAMNNQGGGRLIVTNVWGTCHAQWGNIILLHAVARNLLLRDCVDKEHLRVMTENVRRFLKDVARNGSALETDILVLEEVAASCGMELRA